MAMLYRRINRPTAWKRIRKSQATSSSSRREPSTFRRIDRSDANGIRHASVFRHEAEEAPVSEKSSGVDRALP